MPNDSYGNTDRLDPTDARQFIEDLIRNMRRRGWEIAKSDNPEVEFQNSDEDLPSEAKQYYGDTWTFIYGISSGMGLMNAEHEKEIDWDNGGEIDLGISGDESWQEHCDQYGYGVYGCGLKIGKRLAFYEDREFEFSADTESDSENTFTITSYE